MKQPIIFDEDLSVVRRVVSAAGGSDFVDDRDAVSFGQKLQQTIPFETGLLPPGVISIRQAGKYQQIVIAVPPGIYPTIWGARERDQNAKTYNLAQPYRLVVGEFKENGFLGCRTFFSPTTIYSEDIPLYHVPMPNINCRGYNGTGVGWVCLYHRHDTTNMTIAEKAAYCGLRCSGNEAYNDGNMSRTDGPRFYRDHGGKKYFTDPAAWDKKSEKEGWEWTLNADEWLPILVKSEKEQLAHDPNGIPLTLGMVMRGGAPFYYPHTIPNEPRPFNSPVEKLFEAKNLYEQILVPAWAGAKRVKVTEVPKPKPAAQAAKVERAKK